MSRFKRSIQNTPQDQQSKKNAKRSSFAQKMKEKGATSSRPVESEPSSPHVPVAPKSWGLNMNEMDKDGVVLLSDHLSDAKNPKNSWLFFSCPKCQESSHPLAVCDSGNFWCASCGYHGNSNLHPSKYRGTWLLVWREYLTNPSLSRETPDYLSYIKDNYPGSLAHTWKKDKGWFKSWHAWCVNDKKELVDAFIYESDNDEWFRMPFVKSCPFGWGDVFGSKVVFTTNIKDMMVLVDSGVESVCALPPGLSAQLPSDPVWQFMELIEGKIKDMNEIVFATPPDSQSRQLEDELGRRMDRERCYRVRWHTDDFNDVGHSDEEKDIESAFLAHGADGVKMMVDIAQPFPVIGIHELNDINDRFEELYEHGLVPGERTGWPGFDTHYTVKTGQWTAVTGIPGHGKSSVLDALLVNLAQMHGWRFGLFSPENQPIERHFASLMEKTLKKPFSEGPTPRITPEEKNQTKRWLNDKFKIILPSEEGGLWTLDAVLDLAKILVYRYGIRGIVIDPWNELDHTRSSNINETNHISESLTKVRRFARLYDVHIWIVAHPTKLEKKMDGNYPVATPYDISGGAHWRNKADNAMCVYRYVDREDSDVVDIYVQKIRFKEVGRIGMWSLRCHVPSGAYVDDINQEKRSYSLNNGTHTPSSSMRLSSPREYIEDEYGDEESQDIDFL